MSILLVIFLECVIADHRQPEITDTSRQPLQDNTNRRDHTGQRSAANTENRNRAAGQQQLSLASRCRAACASRLSRRRAVRPSHLTASCAARRAAGEAAAAVAAAAAIAAEHRAADAEQRRQDRAAAAEQHRQDRAAAAEQRKQDRAAALGQQRQVRAAAAAQRRHYRAADAEQRRKDRTAAAEQRRQDRQAATEQRRQDRARAASLHNLGRQQLDCFGEEVFQHSKLQKLTDVRTKRLSIGLMRHICGFCGAKHFLCEKTGGTIAQPRFSNCCYKGKVQLPPIRRYPPYWKGLLRRNDEAGKHFRSFGRRYNQVLSMASAGADIDTSLFDGHGPPTFRIKGKMSHLIASLLPVIGQIPNSVRYISTRVQTLSWAHA